jgi:serine/threonine protein kinase
MLRSLKHPNIVTLVDVYAKVEDEEHKVGIFPWFLTIEEEPIVWVYENGMEEEKSGKILKWYIILEYCACSIQNLIDHAPDNRLSIDQSHRYSFERPNPSAFLHK